MTCSKCWFCDGFCWRDNSCRPGGNVSDQHSNVVAKLRSQQPRCDLERHQRERDKESRRDQQDAFSTLAHSTASLSCHACFGMISNVVLSGFLALLRGVWLPFVSSVLVDQELCVNQISASPSCVNQRAVLCPRSLPQRARSGLRRVPSALKSYLWGRASRARRAVLSWGDARKRP